MQVLLIIALMGSLYATVMGVTSMLAKSSAELAEQRIVWTKQLFKDAEFAVKRGVLSEKADLSAESIVDLQFVGKFVKWTEDELINDFWSKSYGIYTFTKMEFLYSDGLGNSMQAPVTVFALVSGGGDLNIQTVPPTTYAQASALEALVGSDDIVHTFNTYSAMLTTWNEMKDAHTKISALISEDYNNQFGAFQDEIAAYNTVNTIDITDPLTYDVNSNLWRTGLVATTGYPLISTSFNELDISAETKKIPEGVVILSLDQTGFTVDEARYKVNVIIASSPSAGSHWDGSYSVEIDGRE